MMTSRRHLLWIDGGAGAAVGLSLLFLNGWLVEWYQLPRDFLYLMGWANLTYGVYSLSLASRQLRPPSLIRLLVAANLAWSVLCLRWGFVFSGTASPLGLAHLTAEALFVGGLAFLEWRWREQLR